METVSAVSLGNEIRDAIKRAQETGQRVDIADENGQIIAYLVPNQSHTDSASYGRAWTELDRLIDAISPYLPEHVDAVQAIRDVRR